MPGITLRLALVAADAGSLRIGTVLDDTHRVRQLPAFTLQDDGQDRVIQTILRRLGLETEDLAHLYWQQMGLHGGGRVLDVLGLIADRKIIRLRGIDWWPLNSLFPWEDWRKGPPPALQDALLPELYRWCSMVPGSQPADCVEVARLFADRDHEWVPQWLQLRYDMLYRAGLLPEALRDRSGAAVSVRNRHVHIFGQTMAGDDRQMLARAISSLRRGMQTRPLPFFLLPGRFSLGALQKVTEGLMGIALHTQNFRRDILRSGFLEDTGRQETRDTRRPARLYSWVPGLNPHQCVHGMPLPRRKTGS